MHSVAVLPISLARSITLTTMTRTQAKVSQDLCVRALTAFLCAPLTLTPYPMCTPVRSALEITKRASFNLGLPLAGGLAAFVSSLRKAEKMMMLAGARPLITLLARRPRPILHGSTGFWALGLATKTCSPRLMPQRQTIAWRSSSIRRRSLIRTAPKSSTCRK